MEVAVEGGGAAAACISVRWLAVAACGGMAETQNTNENNNTHDWYINQIPNKNVAPTM